MGSREEHGIFRLIPRLGRRAGHASIQEEKSDEDQLESSESVVSAKKPSGRSAKGPAPVAPPRARKTGWGDELKSAKQRGISTMIEDRMMYNRRDSRDDDIPEIPDLDEIIEDTGALDISNAPTTGTNRAAAAYKELDTDLLKNQLFSTLDGVDLSLLTEKLYPEHLVQEPDEVWSWESLFTQVASEINSEPQIKVDKAH